MSSKRPAKKQKKEVKANPNVALESGYGWILTYSKGAHNDEKYNADADDADEYFKATVNFEDDLSVANPINKWTDAEDWFGMELMTRDKMAKELVYQIEPEFGYQDAHHFCDDYDFKITLTVEYIKATDTIKGNIKVKPTEIFHDGAALVAHGAEWEYTGKRLTEKSPWCDNACTIEKKRIASMVRSLPLP